MQIQGRQFVVFGAAGSVGRALIGLLSHLGASSVFAVVKNIVQRDSLFRTLRQQDRTQNIFVHVADVLKPEEIGAFGAALRCPTTGLGGVIYAVGHCPSGGIMAEVGTPLNKLPTKKLLADYETHVIGFQNVMGAMLPLIAFGGHVVAIGSAITTLSELLLPKGIFDKFHAGSYAQAKAAQLELVKWLQRDPAVRRGGVCVDYLGLGAIDTPFHRGLPDGQGPPSLISLDEVGARVVRVIRGSVPVIKFTRTVPAPIANARWWLFRQIFDKREL